MLSPIAALPASFKEGNKPHRWSTEEKIVLCVLQRHFVSNVNDAPGESHLLRKDRAAVMKEYFAPSFDHAMTLNAFQTHFAYMKLYGAKEYLQVFSSDFSKSQSAFAKTRRELASAARRCGVRLRARSKVDEEAMQRPKIKIRKRPRTDRFKDLGVLGAFGDDENSYVEETVAPFTPPSTPKKPRIQDPRSRRPQPSPISSQLISKAQFLDLEAGSAKTPGTAGLQSQLGNPNTMEARFFNHQQESSRTAKRFSDDAVLPPSIQSLSHVAPSKQPALGVLGSSYLPNTTLSLSSDCSETVRRGLIAYRMDHDESHTSNTLAGLRAGAYVGRPMSPPPEFGSQAFGVEAYKHIHHLPQSSKFISLFMNLTPVLHRALVSPVNHNAHITIINLALLYSRKIRGLDRVYPAAQAIKKYDIVAYTYKNVEGSIFTSSGGRNNRPYNGTGEMLVWGEIEAEAVICCYAMTELRAFFDERPFLKRLLSIESLQKARGAHEYSRMLANTDARKDEESGRAIGELLSFMKCKEWWIEDVATNIARRWSFKQPRSPRPQTSLSYMQGVRDGWKLHEFRRGLSQLPLRLEKLLHPAQGTQRGANGLATCPSIKHQHAQKIYSPAKGADTRTNSSKSGHLTSFWLPNAKELEACVRTGRNESEETLRGEVVSDDVSFTADDASKAQAAQDEDDEFMASRMKIDLVLNTPRTKKK